MDWEMTEACARRSRTAKSSVVFLTGKKGGDHRGSAKREDKGGCGGGEKRIVSQMRQ